MVVRLALPACFGCLASLACLGCSGDPSATNGAGGASGGGGTSSSVGGTGGGGGAGGARPVPAHCFSGSLDVQPAGTGWLATTTHYRLTAEATEAAAEEMARLLEASYAAHADYFAAEPPLVGGELLDVRFYADHDAWAAALVADGVTPSAEAGGYYDTGSEVAYLYDQPTRYFTHELLMHEAAHQFHHLARGGGIGQPGWYVEGLAEYLQRHDWDGACVRLGVLPLLTQEDSPASALSDVETNGVDLAGIVGGSVAPTRAIAWSVVHYLEHGDGAKWQDGFRLFRDAMDGGTSDVLAAFTTAIAEPAALERPFVTWLPTSQEPMSIVFLEWTHVGPAAVIGDSEFLSAATIKDASVHLEAHFDVPASASWGAGVLLDFDNPTDFTALVVRSVGTLSTFEMVGGSATWFDQGSAPPASNGGYTLVVDFPSAGMVDVTINGIETSYGIANSPRTGLVVDGSRVAFDGIALSR